MVTGDNINVISVKAFVSCKISELKITRVLYECIWNMLLLLLLETHALCMTANNRRGSARFVKWGYRCTTLHLYLFYSSFANHWRPCQFTDFIKPFTVWWLLLVVVFIVLPRLHDWLTVTTSVCSCWFLQVRLFHGWLLIRTVDLTILCEIWHTVKSHFSLQLFCIALLRSISRLSSSYWFHFHSAITSSESWSWTELIPAKNETFSDVPNFMENLRRHF